jgi:hypothetical protein
MTEEQRKAIDLLNSIKGVQRLDGEPAISEDDYFFLLSFIVDRQRDIYVPTPYPVMPAFPYEPLTPYYGQKWEVTCSQNSD